MKQARVSYIYGLKDPRDGLIYYVGKSDTPYKRLRSHISDKESNQARIEWIDGLSSVGLEPELVILEKVLYSEWRESEIYWIARGYEEGWPLTNISNGGNGGNGYTVPSYDFMRFYIHQGLWSLFDELSIADKDQVCLDVALAMINIYEPMLDNKRKSGQLIMQSIIEDVMMQAAIDKAQNLVVHRAVT